jgi:biotin operon repressor/anti-sigma regulatory factor (Ser/Thr protein kinase)
MKTKDRIIQYIIDKKRVTGKELASLLGISRQALNRHLKTLIQKGLIVMEGNTRGASYSLSGRGFVPLRFKKRYAIQGLEEHVVLVEITLSLQLKKWLRKNVLQIIKYAFSEMLNNAIEHSNSDTCTVEFSIDQYNCIFTVRDFGIGIFHSIRSKFGLLDEVAAVGELTKGKITTAKEKHTGEGVFFTSKCADVVYFRSHRIRLFFDNQREDVFIEKKRMVGGTSVEFHISRSSKRDLQYVLSEYAPDEYDFKFEKTRVFVKLFRRDFISRSEARRLLAGLERFSEIILDFSGVDSIGQGFADEIFRIFKAQHPHVSIQIENVTPIISATINHVVDKIIKQ